MFVKEKIYFDDFANLVQDVLRERPKRISEHENYKM